VITDIEQACDHLIVLGGGRALLAVSIADAIAGHSVVDGSADGGIGTFPSPIGLPLTLLRGRGGRAATLEEVVIGHLAAGRSPRVVPAAQKEAA
jgi:ABC-2 type transport system ATP-binding protein